MEQQQYQNQIDRMDPVQNGMLEYERETLIWNGSNQVQEQQRRRNQMINNTPGYYTGNRIHHLRSIQMYEPELWTQLFGREPWLDPVLQAYAQASMEWANDETNTLLFAGQMDVSLLLQENYRPGIHVAMLFVHLSPHRCFRDGHMVHVEFGEGSQTHQTLGRIFDTNTRAIVLQATEYQILEYLARDDEAMDLLHSCFLQPDFATVRFSFVEPNPYDNDDYGFYVMDPNAIDNHAWHYFADDNDEPVRRHDDDNNNEENNRGRNENAVAIPPPPPINNFAEIYLLHLRGEFHNDDDNIIPYDSDESGDDEPVEARG